jgi:glycosyltransferase involved in cell wall biosynthesis
MKDTARRGGVIRHASHDRRKPRAGTPAGVARKPRDTGQPVPSMPVRLGYLVRAFPRVSETFIMNEILELEAQGFDLRIYTLTDPRDSRRPRLIERVRSPIIRLPERWELLWPSALATQLSVIWRFPLGYVRTLRRVLLFLDAGLLGHFCQAACLVRRLEQDGIAHLHAGFVHAPGSVAWIVHEVTGRSFSLATHAKDLYHSAPVLLRRKLAAARLVFTCTRYNVVHLRTLCDADAIERVRCVYHGTDLVRFSFGTCAAADPPLVLAVARLVEKKGLQDLILACAVLRDRGCRFQCRIVGAGVLHDALTQLIEEQRLREFVSLEGALDQEQVLEWYRRATVVAAPCIVTSDGDRDGIPNVLVEAAACGVPLVSTSVSGVPELVQDGQTGLLVPPRDPLALANALQRLFDSPELRERLRVNARTRVEADLDVCRNARIVGRELRALMRVPIASSSRAAKSVSEKQQHAPDRQASPAKASHFSKITARVARLR